MYLANSYDFYIILLMQRFDVIIFVCLDFARCSFTQGKTIASVLNLKEILC